MQEAFLQQIKLILDALKKEPTQKIDTGIGMFVSFALASGSNFNNTKDSWLVGNYVSTSSQVNGVDSTSNTFQLADVCLVEDNDGQTRVPDFMLAGRDVFEELLLCQRYYEKTHDLESSPSSVGVRPGVDVIANGVNSVALNWKFTANKRIATPLVRSYSTGTGAIDFIRNASNSTDLSSPYASISVGNTQACYHLNTATANYVYYANFTADAEL